MEGGGGERRYMKTTSTIVYDGHAYCLDMVLLNNNQNSLSLIKNHIMKRHVAVEV